MFADEFDRLNNNLEAIERAVVADVKAKLNARVNGTWSETDDDLFAAFTSFAVHCIDSLIPLRATRLWLVDLAPLVEKDGAAASQPIHIGSPLYNCGVCFFFAGDLDRFYQFVGAAEEATNRVAAGPVDLLIGGGLAKDILIRPMVAWLSKAWEPLYSSITSTTLEEQEYTDLIRWLAAQLVDAVHATIALHRLLLQHPPDNSATQHIRVRAVADLCVVLESTTKRWNTATSRDLHAHAESVANALGCHKEFRKLHDDFGKHCDTTATDKKSADAVNWACQQCLNHAKKANALEERRAAALYLSVRLRNSLLHVLDEQLDIYTNKAMLLEAASCVFAAIRLSRIASGT